MHYLRARNAGSVEGLVELGLFGLALLAGSKLVRLVNDGAYLAVMKRAPALGTVWVWAVVEMRLFTAVGSLVLVGGWAWRRGYTF